MADPGVVAAAAAVAAVERSIQFQPPFFEGKPTDDAYQFLRQFERFTTWKGIADDNAKKNLLGMTFRAEAAVWIDSLPDAQKDTLVHLTEAFEKRYLSPEVVKQRSAKDIFTSKQTVNENVDDFINKMRRNARLIAAPDDILRYAIINGLKPQYSAFVQQQKATTIDQITEAARMAELTITTTVADDSFVAAQFNDMQAQIKLLCEKFDAAPQQQRVRTTTAVVGSDRSATPEQHVSFHNDDPRRQRSPSSGSDAYRAPAPDRSQSYYSDDDRRQRSSSTGPSSYRSSAPDREQIYYRDDDRQRSTSTGFNRDRQPRSTYIYPESDQGVRPSRRQEQFNRPENVQSTRKRWFNDGNYERQRANSMENKNIRRPQNNQRCNRCARFTCNPQFCVALNRYCNGCGILGHFQAACGRQNQTSGRYPVGIDPPNSYSPQLMH